MSAPLPAYCTALLAWKTESNLTFSAIAEKLGRPEVWTTALFFGQAKTDEETAQKLLDLAGTPADGLVKYSTIDDPTEKAIPASAIIKGLCGKGVDSKGVDGMITRGGTWEWPPKVSLTSSATTEADSLGPGHLPAVRGLGRVRNFVQGSHQREGKSLLLKMVVRRLHQFGDGIMSAIGESSCYAGDLVLTRRLPHDRREEERPNGRPSGHYPRWQGTSMSHFVRHRSRSSSFRTRQPTSGTCPCPSRRFLAQRR